MAGRGTHRVLTSWSPVPPLSNYSPLWMSDPVKPDLVRCMGISCLTDKTIADKGTKANACLRSCGYFLLDGAKVTLFPSKK
jgi:hypothetical protein